MIVDDGYHCVRIIDMLSRKFILCLIWIPNLLVFVVVQLNRMSWSLIYRDVAFYKGIFGGGRAKTIEISAIRSCCLQKSDVPSIVVCGSELMTLQIQILSMWLWTEVILVRLQICCNSFGSCCVCKNYRFYNDDEMNHIKNSNNKNDNNSDIR